MYFRELLKRQSGAGSIGGQGLEISIPKRLPLCGPAQWKKVELPHSQSPEVHQGVGRLQNNEVRALLDIFQVSLPLDEFYTQKPQHNQGVRESKVDTFGCSVVL